jgi:hypothetical protein
MKYWTAIALLVCTVVGIIASLCILITKGIENDNRFTEKCYDSKGQVVRTKGPMICIKQDNILEVR